MDDQNAMVGSQKAAEPLIQPTSTVISYGADDNYKLQQLHVYRLEIFKHIVITIHPT